MNTDKRSFIAILICVLFYLGYDYFLRTKYPDYGKRPEPATEPAPSTPAAPSPVTSAEPAPATEAEALTRLSAEELTIETDTVLYKFSQANGGFDRVILKDYLANKSGDSGAVNLLDHPLALQGITDPRATPVQDAFNAERDGRRLRFTRMADGIRITQEYAIPENGYGATLKVTFTNTTDRSVDLTAGLLYAGAVDPKTKSSALGFIPGIVTERDQITYRADGDTEWIDLEAFCKGDEDPVRATGASVAFLGLDRHYFTALIEPKAKSASFRIDRGMTGRVACPVTITVSDPQGNIPAASSVALEYGLYFGPKELAAMTTHNPELESAMHLGVFDFIARPLLMVIEGFHKVTGNYGVAIILLTLLLKALFYPLVKASSISAYKMRKINPQIQALREKYKDDRQKQQQEMMKLWMEHKINPMKGCLPILPQIPVFFAFYQVLQTSIQLRHAPFFGWIQDLSAMDPFFVTPLLMGVAMFVQQKLTPTTGMDKTQEKILMFMPVMFTVMMLTLPAGLTLYMLTNTVVGIAQQKWLYHRLDKLGA